MKLKPSLRRLTLNVGLNIGETLALTEKGVLTLLGALGMDAEKSRVATSETEPTVVASVVTDLSPRATRNRVNQASALLGQDCIAIRWSNGKGALVGPKAKQWGKFNPDYFIA